jgi:hypothetical protein
MGENGEVTEVELLASLPEVPGASLSAITRILPKLIRCTPESQRRRKQHEQEETAAARSVSNERK